MFCDKAGTCLHVCRFEAGFVKGVEETAKKLGKTITVDVQYAGSFGDPAKGKAVAAQIYEGGADIIFHASGGTLDAGVFLVVI